VVTNYEIDYNDNRFKEVEADKKAALNEVDVTYGNMISNSDEHYQQLIDATKDYADKQTQLQNEQTEFAIDKIEQQKDQAHKDYIKEQSGAYVDWQQQSNPYGANAEKMADMGLAGAGYSESAKVSMYNTYQNRVVAARESYNLAVQNYNNAITEARLQNNSVLAEIAYESLQKQLELSLQGFQYKNTLILEKAKEKRAIEDTYHGRYQDVLKQINTENALAEEARQADMANARQQEQIKIAQAELKIKQEQWKAQQEATKIAKQKASQSTGRSSSRASASSRGFGTVTKKQTSTTSVNKAKSKTSEQKVTVDMSSVLALGYGPISASRLDELVRNGIVTEYRDGDKLKYKKSATTSKQEHLFGKR
jgi:hypothetical protein